jgi:hypothetical protein
MGASISSSGGRAHQLRQRNYITRNADVLIGPIAKEEPLFLSECAREFGRHEEPASSALVKKEMHNNA